MNSTFIGLTDITSREEPLSSLERGALTRCMLVSVSVSGDSDGPWGAVCDLLWIINGGCKGQRFHVWVTGSIPWDWYSVIGRACYRVAGLVKVYWVSLDTRHRRPLTHSQTHAHKHSQSEGKGVSVGRPASHRCWSLGLNSANITLSCRK